MTQIAVRMSATSSLASELGIIFATSRMGLFLLSRRIRRFYLSTDSWKAIFLVFEDRGYSSDIDALMAELEGQGFHTEDTITKAGTVEPEATSGEDAAQPNEAAPAEDGVTQPRGYGLTVTLPAASLPSEALANLTSLLAAKGRLIRKALGVEDLPMQVSSDIVSFPWCEWRYRIYPETQ